jgi:hypothetical protein
MSPFFEKDRGVIGYVEGSFFIAALEVGARAVPGWEPQNHYEITTRARDTAVLFSEMETKSPLFSHFCEYRTLAVDVFDRHASCGFYE